MKKKHVLFLFLFSWIIASCSHSENEFSKPVNQLEKTKERNLTSYVLYPSTIRMLNTSGDSSFNSSIREIKKIKLLKNRSDKDTFTNQEVRDIVNGIKAEKFVDLMQFQKENQNIQIFMRKVRDTPKEFIGVMHSDNNLIIVDLLGNIPATIFPSILNGNFDFSGFSKLMTVKRPQNHRHGNNSGN